jgi:hypothetical protein
MLVSSSLMGQATGCAVKICLIKHILLISAPNEVCRHCGVSVFKG